MPTICLCHAPADFGFASELAGYLTCGTGAHVFVDEGRIGPGETLAGKVLDGRMADLVLALVSPASAPLRWLRDEWKPAFQPSPGEHVAVAALLCGECRVPDLLRRGHFIDCTGLRLAALRAVKRWVLERYAPAEQLFAAAVPRVPAAETQVERLAASLADARGTALLADTAAALHFAARHGAEFEAVLWAGAGQSAAALAGELAAALGLRLDGELPANVARLRAACEGRRFLVVVDGDEGDRLGLFTPTGLSSVLVVAQPAVPVPPDMAGDYHSLAAAMAACGPACSLELAAEAADLDAARAAAAAENLEARGLILRLDARLDRYRVLHAAPCAGPPDERHARAVLYAGDLPAVRHVFTQALAGGAWPQAADFGRRAAALATREERLAEAFEILEALCAAAGTHGDRDTLEHAAREQAWILERWGRFEDALPLHRLCGTLAGHQLGLGFD